MPTYIACIGFSYRGHSHLEFDADSDEAAVAAAKALDADKLHDLALQPTEIDRDEWFDAALLYVDRRDGDGHAERTEVYDGFHDYPGTDPQGEAERQLLADLWLLVRALAAGGDVERLTRLEARVNALGRKLPAPNVAG